MPRFLTPFPVAAVGLTEFERYLVRSYGLESAAGDFWGQRG
jgi:hypothetical protein